jgi:hypothetical protein
MSAIEGIAFRFHTTDGKHFSINPETDGEVLIFGTYERTGDSMLVRVYGLTVASCRKVGRVVKYKTTERISLSLVRVHDKLHLGYATFPWRFVDAASVEERTELEGQINSLTEKELAEMMSARTKQNIRAFVLNSKRKTVAPKKEVHP